MNGKRIEPIAEEADVAFARLNVCPQCGADWRGVAIPEEYRKNGYYGDPATAPTHYSRLIGVELPLDDPNHYDGVSFWQCPDCGTRWDRFTGEKVRPVKTISIHIKMDEERYNSTREAGNHLNGIIEEFRAEIEDRVFTYFEDTEMTEFTVE